jgi:acetyltransferase-like isoleucine patch superfamily enzyme
MFKFLKFYLIKLIYKCYEIGRREHENNQFNLRYNELRVACKYGKNTRFTSKAIVQNTFRDNNRIKIGNNCNIGGYLMLFGHGGNIEIGDDSFIGEDTRIWSAKKIKIGNRVLISHSVNIHDNISHPLDSSERHFDYKHIMSIGFRKENNIKEEEIIIEDDVWIGFNATIMRGVKIGKGAIIGAYSFVTKDVEEYSVVVGNPLKFIKKTT